VKSLDYAQSDLLEGMIVVSASAMHARKGPKVARQLYRSEAKAVAYGGECLAHSTFSSLAA
jgi:hypothetical protein